MPVLFSTANLLGDEGDVKLEVVHGLAQIHVRVGPFDDRPRRVHLPPQVERSRVAGDIFSEPAPEGKTHADNRWVEGSPGESGIKTEPTYYTVYRLCGFKSN